jgi:Raf kinase inhibitor-like YbhB/YbcL family protein
LEDGAEFLPKHTCEMSGFDMDQSPPLAWTGAPAAAQSFALVFIDTTLTEQGNMNGYHWAMWDIPASVSELPANLPTGATITEPVSAKQYNPLSASYLGPCPNVGGGNANTDTYAFTLYAMPEATTAALAGLNNVKNIEAAIKEVALDSATLTGTSNASPP